MTVRTRADLDALPSYVPGKTVPGAIKLASNEVSAGPLPSVVRAVAEAATAMNRYRTPGAPTWSTGSRTSSACPPGTSRPAAGP
jgi:histidinol-phosphate aminotransferase